MPASQYIPTSKVTAATVAAAFVTAALLGAQWALDLPAPPPGLEGALATLAAFLAGWIKTERSGAGHS